jgi:hypothetical protein
MPALTLQPSYLSEKLRDSSLRTENRQQTTSLIESLLSSCSGGPSPASCPSSPITPSALVDGSVVGAHGPCLTSCSGGA